MTGAPRLGVINAEERREAEGAEKRGFFNAKEEEGAKEEKGREDFFIWKRREDFETQRAQRTRSRKEEKIFFWGKRKRGLGVRAVGVAMRQLNFLCRTVWHIHSLGQTLVVTAGLGACGFGAERFKRSALVRSCGYQQA